MSRSAVVDIGARPADAPGGARVERLGRYLLCFELASGGMASVYLARVAGPEGFEKLVALKRIHPHLAKQQSFVDMFLDEARIASQIDHPNVCPVFDFGEADGSYFIAMEYLMGESLFRVLRAVARHPEQRASPRFPGIVARIVADACEGLHCAHELRDADNEPLKVVHRDISPHNLLVTYDGAVRVVDFGIASATNRRHETQTGEVKGKFAYMSPEQARGKTVDRRADVWALGVVLFEALTLKRLFRRESDSATLLAVLSDRVPTPSTVRSGIPTELDAIVLKALSRDLNERYPSARAMGKDLVAWASRNQQTVGLGDLSEWMCELFPGDRARKRQLVELARQEHDAGPRVPRVKEPSGESSVNSAALEISVAGETRRRRGWIAAGAGASIVVLLGGVVGAWWMIAEPSGADETVVAAEPPPRPPPPPAENDSGGELERPSARAPAAPPSVEPPAEADAPAAPAPSADEQRTRRARPTGSGRVNVVTPGGWAYVELGGRRLGQTPLSVGLPAGRHVLRLRPFGEGPTRRQRVIVRPGRVARVSLPLTP